MTSDLTAAVTVARPLEFLCPLQSYGTLSYMQSVVDCNHLPSRFFHVAIVKEGGHVAQLR